MQTRHLPRQDGMCGGSGERGRALKRQGDSMQGSYSCTSARRSGIYSSNALISTLALGTTTRPQSPPAAPPQQHCPPNLENAHCCRCALHPHSNSLAWPLPQIPHQVSRAKAILVAMGSAAAFSLHFEPAHPCVAILSHCLNSPLYFLPLPAKSTIPPLPLPHQVPRGQVGMPVGVIVMVVTVAMVAQQHSQLNPCVSCRPSFRPLFPLPKIQSALVFIRVHGVAVAVAVARCIVPSLPPKAGEAKEGQSERATGHQYQEAAREQEHGRGDTSGLSWARSSTSRMRPR